MTLGKTSIVNAAAVLAKMLSALFLNKILAMFAGPAGYALIAQFMNFVSMSSNVVGGTVTVGVTKYTAEKASNEEYLSALWRTGLALTLGVAAGAGLAIGVYATSLAGWILRDSERQSVFYWLAVGLPAIGFNAYLLSILNGKKDVPRYVVANIFGSLIMAGLAAVLVAVYSITGALVALAVAPAFAAIVTTAICWRTSWFRSALRRPSITREHAMNLGRFAIMALTSAAVIPLTQISIRNYLASTFGWEATGHWQAVAKIGDLYLLFLTSTLSLYFLPRYSEIGTWVELKAEIMGAYKKLLPLCVVGAVLIYFFRDLITALLFTSQFAAMRDLFFWQLIGDVLKIGSWVVAYVMLGKALSHAYIVTEIIFSATLFAFTLLFTSKYGLIGASIAYAINYAIYWVAVVWIIRRNFGVLQVNAQ